MMVHACRLARIDARPFHGSRIYDPLPARPGSEATAYPFSSLMEMISSFRRNSEHHVPLYKRKVSSLSKMRHRIVVLSTGLKIKLLKQVNSEQS